MSTSEAFGDLARETAAPPGPQEFARHDLNDLGNAMRLILLSGAKVDPKTDDVDTRPGRLLHVTGIGWIGFNGRFWDRKHGEHMARRYAHQVSTKLKTVGFQLLEEAKTAAEAEKAEKASATETPEDKKAKKKVAPGVGRAISLIEWSETSGSAGRTAAMLAQAESYLTVELDEFDRDPLALNTPQGTLKFAVRSGKFSAELHEHDPADRITRMTRADYDPKAACPIFSMVLGDSLPSTEERAYFGRFLGYASTGCTHEQLFGLAQGRGRDGKSTILDCVRETLGSYAEVGNVETFLDGQRSPGGPDPELVKLAGDVRLVVLSEPPRGSKLAEGRLKAWTSGSPVSARDMHAKPITFRPIGKLIWECNAFPVAKGDDDGIWRRVRPMMFRVQVPPEKVDKTLPGKLGAESSGVLNWLIARVGDWMLHGLNPPASLVAVLEDYRRASSPFGEWFQARCIHGDAARDPEDPTKAARTLSSELYADFKKWFEDQGFEKPMGPKAFGDAMRDRQVGTAGKDRTGKQYRGPIRLKTAQEIEAENTGATAPGATGSGSGSAPAAGREADFDDDASPFE